MPPAPQSERVILVVGSTGLDRILVVPSYPIPDSKVRSTNYVEMGGGNAANTACSMALLCNARMFSNTPEQQRHNDNNNTSIRIKLCTRIGSDDIGKKVIDELSNTGIDLSSPLFQIQENTTTGIVYVLVSELEHTRTCIYVPGTCGDCIQLNNNDSNDNINEEYSTSDDLMNEVFGNVIHLHTDSRHTETALLLAIEAKRRGITVSIDIEKDRHSKALDQLIEIADTIFTNHDQLEDYLTRLTREYEEETGRSRLKEANVIASESSILNHTDLDFYVHIIKPSLYFARRYGQSNKHVVITKGDLGAVSVTTKSITETPLLDNTDSTGNRGISNQVEVSKNETTDVVTIIQKFIDKSKKNDNNEELVLYTVTYEVRKAGTLKNINVVDTTGAGDALIGAYILTYHVICRHGMIDYTSNDNNNNNNLHLQFGCWVGGKKVQGIGARGALPTGYEVDTELGITNNEVINTLNELLNEFNEIQYNSNVPSVPSWESFEEESSVAD